VILRAFMCLMCVVTEYNRTVFSAKSNLLHMVCLCLYIFSVSMVSLYYFYYFFLNWSACALPFCKKKGKLFCHPPHRHSIAASTHTRFSYQISLSLSFFNHIYIRHYDTCKFCVFPLIKEHHLFVCVHI